ncbi:hypothetical protein Pan258_01640 [Symmachiella dynata]|uniref:hypothetical protein n=1 Tax=Symmachiella dynata TaxID=2527995 RepID=UPI00118CFC38|nr:hypothetical protein [Symmachiella dynata]QDT46147.1 hypothetical protein Pan258_01640 [Symmachiella dynata]
MVKHRKLEDWLPQAQNGNGGSAFWIERVERISDRANVHPIMVDNVLDIFEETCGKSARTKAHYVLSRMEKTKKIRFIGSVSLNGIGRKRNVYARRNVKRDNLLHEIRITQIVEALGWPECNRGLDVDENKRADAELFIGEYQYFLEFDNGTESRKQVEKRWGVYENTEDPLLVVTTSERRKKSLLRWCDVGYFTTLETVLKDPWGPIWQSCDGRYEAIEKPVE